jgi:hypothetical protein
MISSVAIPAATPTAADMGKTEQAEGESTEEGEQEKEETEIDTCINELGISFFATLRVCNARTLRGVRFKKLQTHDSSHSSIANGHQCISQSTS